MSLDAREKLHLLWRKGSADLAGTIATPAGFEPARAEPIGLAGRRLNHSAKVSMYFWGRKLTFQADTILALDASTVIRFTNICVP